MINTFKLYFKLRKRFKDTHDWFYFNLEICNRIDITLTFGGYGLSIGAWIFDVNKFDDVENE